MPYESIYFDLDGTLIDTVYLHTLAWWKALDAADETRAMCEIHPLIGMGGTELLQRLLGRDDPSISEGHDREFSTMYPMIRPLPGALDLLSAVHAAGYSVVLVSSSKPGDLPHVLKPLGSRSDLFAEVVHGESAERTKPAPDLFQVALEKTQHDPAAVLAVGDAEWDVIASGKAGIASIGLRTGGLDAESLSRAGALAVYDSCSDLLQNWRSSPLADR